jgi:hypothetical protein
MNIIERNDENSEIVFSYTFKFEDGRERYFKVRIDKSTLNVKRNTKQKPPEWTRLKNFKCPHCPLDEKKFEYCPLAVNLSEEIGSFMEFSSFENADITIKTNTREYRKKTSLQAGLGSMYGILMVASDCPVMGKLKPMMRFHLPFATIDETDYRVLSMYLLAQYVIWKNDGVPDWNMDKLVTLYEDIKILNQNVCRKIAERASKDASLNAIVTLNSFAEHVTFILNKQILEKLKILFKEYL